MNESQVFVNVLKLATPAERAAYLDEACAGNAQLRLDVEALLQAHANDPGFLEQPAGPLGATVDSPPALGSLRAPPEAPRGTELPGDLLAGRFKLLQQIGEGGMGTVWLAEQTEPVQRKVALKLIKSGMDSRQVIARFEAERQALALMDHPNIARVLDAGTTGEPRRVSDRVAPPDDTRGLTPHGSPGRPYFVMELVKGVPITRYCDEHHLTPRQRLELFVPVCQAVQHAHQKGITHRDLKPSNVMVCLYDGKPVPKVIDFGIAKAAGQKLTDKTLFTELGQVVGTLEYMSPEQAELNQLDIDTRSDIYSLGVLLYELLTGTTPLERKRFKAVAFLEVLRLIREEESPRPSTRLSTTEGLPTIAANRGLEPKKLSGLMRGELDWIVMKTLEKDRSRRYETANGLAMDVQRYLADEAVQACPPSAWYRFRKFSRRNRGPMLAAALVLIALLLGTAVAAWQAVEATNAAANEASQRQIAENQTKAADVARTTAVNEKIEANVARKTAEEEKKAADAARKTAEDQRDRAEWLVYAGKMSLAQLEFQNNNAAHALTLLEECQGNLRNWEHRHLWARFNSKQTFRGHTHNVTSVCFSPDGKRIASASIDRMVKVWDVQTGQVVLALKGHTCPVNSVCFSPDGKQLASASGHMGPIGQTGRGPTGEVKVWDMEKGLEVIALQRPGYVRSICFSPDGKQLASASQDGVKLWDARTGQELLDLKEHTAVSVCFSPDGKRLASAGRDGTVKIFDAEKGLKVQVLTKRHTYPVSSVCFSPDGKRMASGGGQSIGWPGEVKVWDSTSGQDLLTLKGHTDCVVSVSFSPDGKRIASASFDRTVKVWDAEKGLEILTLKGHTGYVFSVCFSPDGKRLASGGDDQTVKVWDAERGQEVLALKEHTGPVVSVCFSSDSKRLASADGIVRIWDAETGLKVLGFNEGSNFRSICFSPDGKQLASASEDGTVKLWDAQTRQKLLDLKGHSFGAFCVCFSPDGTRLASAGRDGTVKVWDAATGQLVRALRGHSQGVLSVCFSPDGTRLASASFDQTVKVWDAETGLVVLTLRGHTGIVCSVCFSPDGTRLASASFDQTVKVWDAETGLAVLTLKGHAFSVRSVCFSPDGKRLASASAGLNAQDKRGELKLWDAQKGQELLDLKGHTGGVVSVCFSPNGKRLASASWDRTVKVWEAE